MDDERQTRHQTKSSHFAREHDGFGGELFERPDIEQALHDARQVVEDFVAFMDSDAAAMVNLIGLSSHDFYTYNHSLDVSIYSLGLGNAVALKARLERVGLGGLFTTSANAMCR